MDGKHIVLKRPINSGSLYFNYKSNFSIVLLALVDANYKFIYIDVGCNGRISDGGVFRNSTLSMALDKETLNIPKIDAHESMPYVIVADDAFPLKPYIMKPYPQRQLTKEKRIFNYRLSRARRVVENAFGIMASRFRVFLAPMSIAPEKAEKVVLASCVLHNFLREKCATRYTPHGTLDVELLDEGELRPGEWRSHADCLQPISSQSGNKSCSLSQDVREQFSVYFNTVGKVPWQDSFIA